MVPVIATTEFLLTDVRAALRRCISEDGRTELGQAFAGWLLHGTGAQSDAQFVTLVREAGAREGARQDFQTVAILGFGAHAGMVAAKQMEALKSGLRRQTGRGVVIDELPAAFCCDAVGVVGVVLGTKAVADSELTSQVVKWIHKFLKKSYDEQRTEEWQRCLFAAADVQLGGSLNLVLPKSPAVADVRTALVAKGIVEPSDTTKIDTQHTLTLAVRELPNDLGYERAALRFAAIQSIVETTAPMSDPKPNARTSKQPSLSPRDARVHKVIGEERFRTLTNAEIMKESQVKKALHAEGLNKGSDAAKCCLDRIRETKGYLMSSEIRKKRSNQQ
jgi:hypothetical protein